MWGSFCHLRNHQAKPNSVCSLPFAGLNQLPLVIAQVEARSRKLGPNLLGWVQSIPPKGPRRLLGLCGQLLDQDQTRLPIPTRGSLGLSRASGAPSGRSERIWSYRCPQWNNPNTLFSGRTTSVHLSAVRPSRTRPRYVGKSGRKGRWCRSKS